CEVIVRWRVGQAVRARAVRSQIQDVLLVYRPRPWLNLVWLEMYSNISQIRAVLRRAPDAGEIGLAVRSSRYRRRQIGLAVRSPRNSRCFVIQPLCCQRRGQLERYDGQYSHSTKQFNFHPKPPRSVAFWHGFQLKLHSGVHVRRYLDGQTKRDIAGLRDEEPIGAFRHTHLRYATFVGDGIVWVYDDTSTDERLLTIFVDRF